MLLVNSTEFIQVLLGCAKIGALAVPLNVRLAGPEIGYILADSGADVLVFHEPFAAQAKSAVTESGVRVRHVVRAGGAPAPGELGYEDVVSGAAPEPLNGDVDGSDPAVTPVMSFDNGTATVNTDTCTALGYNFDAVKAAFEPFCTQINTLTTAESFG